MAVINALRALFFVFVLLAGIVCKAYPILTLLYQRYRKSKKPCNLPVFNVQDDDWEAAKTYTSMTWLAFHYLGANLYDTSAITRTSTVLT